MSDEEPKKPAIDYKEAVGKAAVADDGDQSVEQLEGFDFSAPTGSVESISDSPMLMRCVSLALELHTWSEIEGILGLGKHTTGRWRRMYNLDEIIAKQGMEEFALLSAGRIRLARRAQQRLLEMIEGNDLASRMWAISRCLPETSNDEIGSSAPRMAMPVGSHAIRDMNRNEKIARATELSQGLKRSNRVSNLPKRILDAEGESTDKKDGVG